MVDVRRRTRAEHSTWAIEGATALDVVLAEPLPVTPGRRSGPVTRISIATDDRVAALAVLRSRVTTESGC